MEHFKLVCFFIQHNQTETRNIDIYCYVEKKIRHTVTIIIVDNLKKKIHYMHVFHIRKYALLSVAIHKDSVSDHLLLLLLYTLNIIIVV